MRIIKLFTLLSLYWLYGQALKGAGATLSTPLYYTWSYYFYKAKDIEVYYESIGSYAGIQKMTLNSIDFASSDIALSPKVLKEQGLVQFPTLETTIDIAYHLQGVDNLKLTNTIIADIFQGKIKMWNHPAILALNPKITLANEKIVVIVRQDKSGSSYHLSQFFSRISSSWEEEIGTTQELKLPYAQSALKSDGVLKKLTKTPFSIGYLASPYRRHLPALALQNDQGRWLDTDNPNYPIVVLNYTITTKERLQNDKTFQEFFAWIFLHGDRYAQKLRYRILSRDAEEHLSKYLLDM